MQLKELMLNSHNTEKFSFTMKVIILFLLFQVFLPRKIMSELYKFHVILIFFSCLPTVYEMLDVTETSFVAEQIGLQIVVTQIFSLDIILRRIIALKNTLQ